MLKKLKSLFIVEEEVKEKNIPGNKPSNSKKTNFEAEPKSGDQQKKEKLPPSPKPDTNPTPRDTNAQPDEKFVNRLLQSLEENNTEGFDYLEYKQSLQSLVDMEMDEGTKYKSSLAMARTMGASPAKLINSAQHYLNVLAKEEKKFQDALKNKHNQVVEGQQQTIKQLETSIAQKQKQIEQLQQEIAKQQAQLEKAKSSIDGEVGKIHSTKAGFYAAYHIVVDQIQADVDNMKKHFPKD